MERNQKNFGASFFDQGHLAKYPRISHKVHQKKNQLWSKVLTISQYSTELGIVHMVLVLQVCKMWEWRNYRGFHRGSRKLLVTKYEQEKYLNESPEWTVCESVKVSPSCYGIPGYGMTYMWDIYWATRIISIEGLLM